MSIFIFRDAERCFRYNGFYARKNQFVFVGDSRIRQIYFAMKRLLEIGQDPLVRCETESATVFPIC